MIGRRRSSSRGGGGVGEVVLGEDEDEWAGESCGGEEEGEKEKSAAQMLDFPAEHFPVSKNGSSTLGLTKCS